MKLPKIKHNQRVIGFRSNQKAPKNIPSKYIVVWSLSNEEKNISNVFSYLVPIRKGMPIKIEYSDTILNDLKKIYKNVKYERKQISNIY